MPLTAGTRLGSFEILSAVGSGGMGEVYRARDSRLGREVAVKVLPALARQDDDARRRFHRETKAVAALSHPNIRSLYDVGEADGLVYAVMELLEGETLRARLSHGRLPTRKAIEVGAAIADALAAAHAKTIVHRDVKPENIFITAAGHVKVLDFGLAKLQERVDAAEATRTASGIVLGTPGYMSPEQVAGNQLDARTDIFSFGCVLYEMVTGRRAFERKTSAETMTAILNDEPPELDGIGVNLRRIIAHCLEKPPDARFQSAQDLAFHLRGLLDSPDTRESVSAPEARRRLWAGVAAVLLATTVVLSLVHFRETAAAPLRPVRFDISPPDHTTFLDGSFALSPDGSRLAFVTSSDEMPARRALWVHSFETGESQPLSSADVSPGPPVWSPAGRFIAFVANDRIKRIAVSGGSPETVVDQTPPLTVGAWTADDIIVFQHNNSLMRVSAAGGKASALTRLDPARSEMLHVLPRFLPDGRHFVYTRISLREGMSGIFVGSIDAKPDQQESRELVATSGRAQYMPSMDDPRVGHLVFNRDGGLLAQSFNAARLELTGEPARIADQVGESVGAARAGFFSTSRTGALAYRVPQPVLGMPVWLDRDGRNATPFLDAPLTQPSQLRLSPDGRRLAVVVSNDIWIYDLAGRPPIRLTSGGGNDMPLWTPDGKRIVYARSGQPFRLLSIPADVAGATAEPVSAEGHFHPHGWSADGRELIAVLHAYSATGWDILGIPMHQKREPNGILRTPFDEGVAGAALSPDGRWLAYSSNATGETEIWVQPYPGPGASARVSSHGGADPQWARDGRHLYYRENRKLMAVAVEAGSTFDFKPPAVLFELPELAISFPNQSYDVAPDGRFITIKAVATPAPAPPISVIVNWTAGLPK